MLGIIRFAWWAQQHVNKRYCPINVEASNYHYNCCVIVCIEECEWWLLTTGYINLCLHFSIVDCSVNHWEGRNLNCRSTNSINKSKSRYWNFVYKDYFYTLRGIFLFLYLLCGNLGNDYSVTRASTCSCFHILHYLYFD